MKTLEKVVSFIYWVIIFLAIFLPRSTDWWLKGNR